MANEYPGRCGLGGDGLGKKKQKDSSKDQKNGRSRGDSTIEH